MLTFYNDLHDEFTVYYYDQCMRVQFFMVTSGGDGGGARVLGPYMSKHPTLTSVRHMWDVVDDTGEV